MSRGDRRPPSAPSALADERDGRRPTLAGKPLPPLWQSYSARRTALLALTYVVLVAGSAFVLIPFLWALSASVKSLDEVYQFPPRLLPERFQWGNYARVIGVLPFPTFLLNSVIVTGLCVIGQVVTGSLVAFSFARLRWPGRDFWFVVLLSTMMLPGQVTMIPHFILYTQLGWVGTFLPLVVPSYFGGAAVYIFLMRQFFKTIPLELEDAARIDGCSSFGVFSKVILPLSRPVLATVAILSFIAHWHDFMGPLIYLDSFDKYTLQIGLRMFQDIYGTFMHWLMAASMLVLLPVLVIFFLGQRYFVRGIVLTGLKG